MIEREERSRRRRFPEIHPQLPLTQEHEVNFLSLSDDAIPVGASDTTHADGIRSHFKLTDFSTRSRIELVAPGQDVPVDFLRRRRDFIKESGASFSAPFIAGGIALMRQVNPGLTVADIRAILKKTAEPARNYAAHEAGAGYVNLPAAVAKARKAKAAVA